MDIINVIIMLLIGVFGGFISGLVGIGGAIIIYPAFLFLPPLFDATFVNVVYIIIALLALILMFIKVESRTGQSSFNKPLLVIIGHLVGIISGIVRAGVSYIISFI